MDEKSTKAGEQGRVTEKEKLPEPPKPPPSVLREQIRLRESRDYGINLLWVLGRWVKNEDMCTVTSETLKTEFRFLSLQGEIYPQWHWRTKGETSWERLDRIYITDDVDPALAQHRACMNSIARMLQTLEQPGTPDDKKALMNTIDRQSKIKRGGIAYLKSLDERQVVYYDRHGVLTFCIYARSDNTIKDIGAKTALFGFVDGQWKWSEVVDREWTSLDQKYVIDWRYISGPEGDKNILNHIADRLNIINLQQNNGEEIIITRMTHDWKIPVNLNTGGNLMDTVLEIPLPDGKIQKIKIENGTYTGNDGKQRSHMFIVDVDRNKKYMLFYSFSDIALYPIEAIHGKYMRNGARDFDAVSLHFKVDIGKILEESGMGYASFLGNVTGPSSVVAILDTATIHHIGIALSKGGDQEIVTTPPFVLRFDTSKTDFTALQKVKSEAKEKNVLFHEDGYYLIFPDTTFKLLQTE